MFFLQDINQAALQSISSGSDNAVNQQYLTTVMDEATLLFAMDPLADNCNCDALFNKAANIANTVQQIHAHASREFREEIAFDNLNWVAQVVISKLYPFCCHHAELVRTWLEAALPTKDALTTTDWWTLCLEVPELQNLSMLHQIIDLNVEQWSAPHVSNQTEADSKRLVLECASILKGAELWRAVLSECNNEDVNSFAETVGKAKAFFDTCKIDLYMSFV